MTNHIMMLLNKRYPTHINHDKTPLPIVSLSYRFQCSCGTLLHLPLIATLVS